MIQGVDFEYEQLGKAIPPPKDRLPSGGNYKEMPEGVQGTQGGQPPREPYQEETNSQVMSGVDASAPASNSVPAGARTGTASSG